MSGHLLVFLLGLVIGWIGRSAWNLSVELLTLYREQLLEIEDDE